MPFGRIKEILRQKSRMLSDTMALQKISDNELIDIGRCYVAVYDLVTTCGADELIAGREILKSEISAMFEECADRCAKPGATMSRKAGLIELLYALSGPNLQIADPVKSSMCDRIADELICEWLEYMQGNKSDNAIEIGVLKAITELCYGMMPYGREEDDEDIYMQYLHSVIESWVQQQDIDGGWYDIDENTAIARIEIMSRNSYMLMDSSYDSALFKAIIYYGREERKSEFEILCEEAAEILQEEIINI